MRASVRLNKLIDDFVANPVPTRTWVELLREAEVPEDLIRRFFIPAFARPWGMKPTAMANMPAAVVGQWIAAHRTLTPRPRGWRWNVGGAQLYANLLVDRLRQRGVKLHHSKPVSSIETVGDAVAIHLAEGTQLFDHVVVATNARQALALLQTPTPQQQAALAAFPYEQNTVIVHGDARLMPADRKNWSYFNVRYDQLLDETYNTIWFGKDAGAPVFATNHRVLPFEPTVFHARYAFEQPIFGPNTLQAREQLAAVQGHERLWFSGIYGHGTGHHEDGLVMGSRVAAGILAAATRPSAAAVSSPSHIGPSTILR